MGIKFDKISISGSVNSLVTPMSPEYWVSSASISSLSTNATKMARDSLGNMYVAGRLNSYTSVLYKFSSNGNLVWARSITGNTEYITLVTGFEVDSNDNVYLVQYERNSAQTIGIIHALKITQEGSLIWQRSISKASTLFKATAFVVRESDQSIVIVGEVFPATSGSNDIFYAVISPTGSVSGLRNIGDYNAELGHGISIDTLGNIYIGGWGSWATGTQGSLSKWTSSISRVWANTYFYSTASDVRLYELKLDSDALYSVGEVFISGNRTAILTKYNMTGSVLWTRVLGSSGIDYFYSLDIDADGSIYVNGYTTSTTGSVIGLVVAKYLADGTLSWQRIIEDSSGPVQPTGVLVTDSSVMIAGSGNAGVYLFKLPKDGTLTGVYGNINYKVSTLTSSTLSWAGTTGMNPASASRTDTVTTTGQPFNVVMPTSSIISIG